MSIDPAFPFPIGSDSGAERLARRLADHERRIGALERGNPVIQVISGAPTSAPREGAPIASSATPRLYLYINGVWRFTTLT